MAGSSSNLSESNLVMLVDGNSLIYRAFFALPEEMATASGQSTNAVYGFAMMLLKLLSDHKPQQVVVVLDHHGPTFRHQQLSTYKANRDKTPDTLIQQLGLVRQMVETLKIPVIQHPGVEADDVIATLATQARDQGDNVMVVTGDRDSYQLVEDPHIKVLYNRRGVSDYTLYDEAQIEERTGVKPSDYVAYAALRGDASDNLPGADGVGEKTAARLINHYGSIDELFSCLDDQSPKLKENLEIAEERVRMNLELMELKRDVPLGLGVGDLQLGEPDTSEVRKLFDLLEFRRFDDQLAETLGIDLGGEQGTTGGEGATELEVVVNQKSAEEAALVLNELANQSDPVALAPSWGMPSDKRQPQRRPLLGLALVTDINAGEVAWLAAETLDSPPVRDALAKFFGGESRFIAHDAKPLVFELLKRQNSALGLMLDTQIAAYLLSTSDPWPSAEDRYPLEHLLAEYANMKWPKVTGPSEGQQDLMEVSTPMAKLAALQALAVAHLEAPLREALASMGMQELNDELEVPLVRVLARMELVGIGVDVDSLSELRDKLAHDAEKLRNVVIEAAGEEINVNSPKQLSVLLFDKLGLTPQKKTKTGYSTNAATLEKLRYEHSVVGALLDYREVEKLRSTYGEGLMAAVSCENDKRIRTTFKQTVARTGRLSSDAPNLHNIPTRTEAGRVFRQVFRAEEGCSLLVADYNQIELRCIAHLAEDPGLISAFESGEDVHKTVAAQVFNIEPDRVGFEERSTAKMVSYGLAYGMEAYGLGQRLNIPTGEAALILEAYFGAFPAVRDYMNKTVAETRERGYTETMFGRRRTISELNAKNSQIRQAAERQAMNAGIQGLAADIFKVALVRLDREVEERGLVSRIILQVHDEVILEVPDKERDETAELTENTMIGACQLRVPLEVHLSFGHTWADAK